MTDPILTTPYPEATPATKTALDQTIEVGDTVLAVVQSKFKSKTNITAALVAVLGLLEATHVIPATLDATSIAGALVALGAIGVAYFRTTATSILK